MEGALIFLAMGLIVALVIWSAAHAQKLAEKRRADLYIMATRLGFEFFPVGPGREIHGGFWERLAGGDTSAQNQFLSSFEGFHPFGEGHSPEVNNLMTGKFQDMDWLLFDYSYKITTSNGKSTQTSTHPFGVICARMNLRFPAVTLQEENFGTRIAARFGMQDISVELEEFNRRYLVQASDEKFCYSLLHPKAIEYLMQIPVRHWQIAGENILVACKGTITPAEFERVMTDIRDFYAHIPDFVRQDYGTAGRA